ncbi:hypothetical protein SRS16CHR_05426 [Variovorax sp. SRS16]|uniref:hypothetical protein n=1 Tax=Variovorax sp. SRS16 TaxID=282217 RepID=UPI00131696D2|nr:hypothetical protein [Variovorax sp. SRS16]VTU34132.1 hypothetical protein SRS16CHR_05426 [Variovorax sp. SRS16]
MKTLIALLFATTLCALAGCASRGVGASDGDRAATTTGGSGITVFGTVDAAVSGTRNR